ncbi:MULTISPECIES: hemerythrin domain-containing protein [unclassified Nonomuraea]
MTTTPGMDRISIAGRRRTGDPRPDLTGLRVVYRAMREDLHRLTDLVTELKDGRAAIPAERAVAIHEYIAILTEEIARFHDYESGSLWPVVATSAGGAISLEPYLAHQVALAPLLEEARAAAARFAHSPAAGVAPLASVLRVLGDRIEEHTLHKEQDILPVIATYVSVADYRIPGNRWREGISRRRLNWISSWAERFATAQERRHLHQTAGAVSTQLIPAVLRRRAFNALERRVFGTRAEGPPRPSRI